ncbi:DUF2244 domain-containing protein [Actibacterium sp. 188UL27-1]|uniref:DUF2244 domain-containing protein n=1 Tax=Actibacterium sp. 188UL27-1 TaxID=2786961 RepID=UPI00195C6A03|nr:DUF2244 domain-containing protein [Actibacterium sp. 188UL27-1]MBM7068173.1 DUF2244 domain-containing protein [Actibacterium sp. 188UL27-1]
MPYQWSTDTAPIKLSLWPHRSLPKQGFVGFIAATAALISLPLFSVLGSPILWGLLPFLALAVAGLWWGLQRSYRDGEILEELTLWPERVELIRHNPRGPQQEWKANPYWVRIEMHKTGGPVENYITLCGGGRDVEIGAFLSAQERLALYDDLNQRWLRP